MLNYQLLTFVFWSLPNFKNFNVLFDCDEWEWDLVVIFDDGEVSK